MHLILLHRQSPSLSASDIADGGEYLSGILAKDLALTLLVFVIVFFPSTKEFVHPDNWNGFSRLVTPTHIEPEAYFLWTFSAIKLHNSKVLGAIFRRVLGCYSLWESC